MKRIQVHKVHQHKPVDPHTHEYRYAASLDLFVCACGERRVKS